MKIFLFNCTIAILSICFIPSSTAADEEENNGPMQNPKGGYYDDDREDPKNCYRLHIPNSLDLLVQGPQNLGNFNLQNDGMGMPAMHLAIYKYFPNNVGQNPLDISTLQQIFISESVYELGSTDEYCDLVSTPDSPSDRIFSYTVDIPSVDLIKAHTPVCEGTSFLAEVHLIYAIVARPQNQWILYPVDLFPEHFECLLPVVDGNPWITYTSLLVSQDSICCIVEQGGINPRQASGNSIDAEHPEYKVFISPNPVRDQFQIETNFTEIVSLQVVNLTGATVFESVQNVKSIDASSWEPGMYIIHIKRFDATITRKLLKL